MIDIRSRFLQLNMLCCLLLISACGRGGGITAPVDREAEWNEITKSETAERGIAAEDKNLLGKTYRYTGYYLGFPVMDFVLSVEERKGIYYARGLTYTRGLLHFITRLESDAAAFFRYNNEDDRYQPIRYHMTYSIRGKERNITMRYAADGTLENELIEPAVKDAPIEDTLKNNTYDPFTSSIEARRLITRGKKSFSLPVYSGRTLTDMHVRSGDKKGKHSEQQLFVSYTPVGGYTEEEIEEFKESEFIATMWFDAGEMMVTYGGADTKAGTARFELQEICDTLEACLD